MKIDRINATILKELLKDGRKNFTDIAQQCNVSKEVIANRYKQMKKQGIIVGATIHNSCACYNSNFIVSFDIYTQLHKADYVTKLLNDLANLIEVYPEGVNPNLCAIFTVKTMQEIEQTKQSIKQLPYVLEVEAQVWLGMCNKPDNLSVLANAVTRENEENKSKENNHIEIDEIDKFLIEKLVTNGRTPFSNISKELGISTDTVTRRYEKLKRNRDIKPVIQINPLKIGYRAFALFKLSFSQDNLSRSVEAISLSPDINFIHKTSGKFDCIASLMIKDIDQFVGFKEQILGINNLTNWEISVSRLFPVWPLRREFLSTF
jgi:DNA-binding Lrp family transcriptional regulator